MKLSNIFLGCLGTTLLCLSTNLWANTEINKDEDGKKYRYKVAADDGTIHSGHSHKNAAFDDHGAKNDAKDEAAATNGREH